ncbi:MULTISPECIES: GntR family transcriptional regulator [Aeribacillus]|jgi:DNA-binding GntR family transcriptional regulator|uniref:GntR family transcriptional regulator n=2 Tax=Aeribacillus TaxID=1055323 RepID=A0A163Y1M9_9BACI|nr:MULTISPECIES: GntR family transcriptional regulator [Aeribacillus]REJ22149.1 MAG: GntR family transcriptional regulator [Bacillaceae bacterium]KZM53092.1 GntR family transcriptional regulator [Aeribacillus pallidus]KZN96529.1 GntR family transcriptional regulator [Aeribacillus pallidus]MDR9795180.1 GntR family transcriptional regulator [Aeribacillus pallidus]MED0651932.1 GntR family transcriptional regulator [Aeribacillus composti]
MKNNQLFYNHSLSHKIAEKITNQIMAGELKPGEKIIESTYAEEFGTSRAPIRESLYLLENEGLIERIPRKGAVVKGYTEDEVYDLLEMRIVLESLAMKRIKVRGINEEILKKMEQLVQKMSEVDDEKQYANLNQEFHMLIIEMSKSEIIKEMYWRLGRPLLVLQRISFLEEEHIKKSLKEHRIILDLLKENLIDEALVLLENHNHSVIKRVENKTKNKQSY